MNRTYFLKDMMPCALPLRHGVNLARVIRTPGQRKTFMT